MKSWKPIHIELAVLIGVVLTFFSALFLSFAQDCEQVEQEVLRLHILANSDSAEDQELKLKVRDCILAHSDELFESSQSLEDARDRAAGKLKEISELAQAEVERLGYDYPVCAQLTHTWFGTREYERFTMPCGEYDALRLTIGEGKGHNWWCVVFPPLCVPAASHEEDLKWFEEQGLTVLEQKPQYEPRFAVLELWEKMFGH